MGWACVLLEHDAMERKVFYGAANDGTINIGELLAYLVPLTWYANKVFDERKKSKRNDVRHVHIITDSQYAQSRGELGGIPVANSSLFYAFAFFNRLGIQLHWHWVERETVELNRYVDGLSKAARLMFKTTNLQTVVTDALNLTPEDCNPWE